MKAPDRRLLEDVPAAAAPSHEDAEVRDDRQVDTVGPVSLEALVRSGGAASATGLLSLQRTVGNHAVSDLLASGAARADMTRAPTALISRNGITLEEKKKRMRGLKQMDESNPTAVATQRSIVDIKEDISEEFDRYASMSKSQASEKCEKAAEEIGGVLKRKGYDVHYLCAVWWPKVYEPYSGNHYVVLVGDAVIDATAQQFGAGEEPRIVSFSTWFADLRAKIKPATLAKYVRGSWSDCQQLGGVVGAGFWQLPGEPLHDYDAAQLKRFKEMADRLSERPGKGRRAPATAGAGKKKGAFEFKLKATARADQARFGEGADRRNAVTGAEKEATGDEELEPEPDDEPASEFDEE